jgi:FkbH-like protein
VSDLIINENSGTTISSGANLFVTKDQALRQQAEEYLERGLWLKAQAALSRIWNQEPTAATASYVVPRYERLRSHVPLTTCRLAVLRSFTVEPLIPLLRAAAFANSIDLSVYLSPFNAYAQEVLNENSSLYRFKPEVAILAVQTRDVAPELWESFTEQTEEERTAAEDRVAGGFRTWIQAFRSKSKAHLVVHNLELPALPAQGMLDAQSETSQGVAIHEVNQELRRIARACTGVYIFDYDSLVARHGRCRWHDERKWLTMRMPVAAENLVHLAKEWLGFIHPLVGKICKALVTDLDNTLWGGVIGEDGIEGIQLGLEYPGASYRSLQRAMIDLYNRGIILAICSKNNPSDAMEMLEKHPGMLLRPEHFASLRINWKDKAENLREIAAELNIGIDSLAFLDDNPVERERIRTALPEVTIIELPDDPMEFARALRSAPAFERLALSEEDRERGRYYAEQRQRVELERDATTLEDFYQSLDQEVKIAAITGDALVRVAQLTQKTNQFNLTTRRYSEQQIAELTASADWRVYAAWVKDRFGDNGLVGVVITHDTDGVCEIDTFLMSCRVVGRTVETAILSFLAESALCRGLKRLEGWYLPTKKNDLAKEFYPTHQFQIQKQQDGQSLWFMDLEKNRIACPEWIRLVCDTATPQ